MSWTDIFYPDNPKRRAQVKQLTQSIVDDMKDNTEATNDLVDMLNKNCKTGMTKIQLNVNGTIGENAHLIINKLNEIKSYVAKTSQELAEKLEPAIYTKLVARDTSFEDRVKESEKALSSGNFKTSTVGGIVIVMVIQSGNLTDVIVGRLTGISQCPAAKAAFILMGIGIDMIVSAIVGADERKQLNEAIEKLQAAYDEFHPATQQYTKTIYYVEAKMEALS